MGLLRRAGSAGLLACAAILGACAAAPPRSTEEFTSPALHALPPGSAVALLPVKSPPTDLAAGDQLVLKQLQAQLGAAGFRVVTADAARFDADWSREVQAVGGLYDPVTGALRTGAYGRVLSRLAQRVAQDTHAVAVIDHRLMTRRAQSSGSDVEWDGQRRTQTTVRAYGSTYRFDGTTTALSVQLLVLSADGELLLKSYGGSALPYVADVREGRYLQRPDLFASDAETADGVRLALRPLLQPPVGP